MERIIKKSPEELVLIAKRLRRIVIDALYEAGSGHPGSSMSVMDLLVTLYFGGFLNHDPKNPEWKERDLFLLSNGHAAPALYAILAEAGYFDFDELNGLRKLGRGAQGHPKRGSLSGVEISSGSLGQGLSVGIGLAYCALIKNTKQKVFVIMSDGEQQEGSTWEAVMLAPKLKLNNLTAIIDKNQMQIDGSTHEIMPSMDSLAEKYLAFGWEVKEINGHNFEEITGALSDKNKSGPRVIIANTLRGKGVSFMEGSEHWHAGKITTEQYEQAKKDINKI
jgi:transketolase